MMPSDADLELWDGAAARYAEQVSGHRHCHRPLSWYVEQLVRHGFVLTGLHEPPALPHHLRPEAEWTAYERWFSRIPTMLAVACQPR
jgi:hypothetical protein